MMMGILGEVAFLVLGLFFGVMMNFFTEQK